MIAIARIARAIAVRGETDKIELSPPRRGLRLSSIGYAMGVAGVLGWILVVALIVVINRITDSVTIGPIESWARHSGFRLRARRNVWLEWHPFLFNRSTSQVIYFLELEDSTGSRRSAYVKCGSPILGALLNPDELVITFVGSKAEG